MASEATVPVQLDSDESYPVYSLRVVTPDPSDPKKLWGTTQVSKEFVRRYERVMQQYDAMQEELKKLMEARHE